jgi:uncharacterized protein (DUF2141 family)
MPGGLRLGALLLGITAATVLWALSATAEETSRLDITIAPVRLKDGGNLIVALYADEDSWLELDRAFRVQTHRADAETVRVSFDGIPPGEYALQVIHDKNENGKFDMRWFPYPRPKEGAGVSNDHVRKGKPHHREALFTVQGDAVALHIRMHY